MAWFTLAVTPPDKKLDEEGAPRPGDAPEFGVVVPAFSPKLDNGMDTVEVPDPTEGEPKFYF